jgi:hypothetical protein
MKRLLLLIPFLIFSLAPTFAEGLLPTAQELVALVEVGGSKCVADKLTTEQDQIILRNFVASLFRKRSYKDYLDSSEYATASEKFKQDILKNGSDPTTCQWLKSLPQLPPDEVMFFEPLKLAH